MTGASPCASIDDVIARMREIAAALPEDDGVAHFNRLYLSVTEAVRDAVATATFEDGRFLARLDIVFANLYLAAYDASVAGERISPAWAPLFAHRHHGHRVPLQFAMAGMNAHINHDLPLAVIATCDELELTPHHGSPQHRDYEKVNELLRQVEGVIRDTYMSGLAARIQAHLGERGDAFAMAGIHVARAAAWHRATHLWGLRRHPHLYHEYLRVIAAEVDLAGRALVAL